MRLAPLRAWAPFLLLAVCALALAWPVLAWPMTYDDLHLIRAYSGAEIRSALVGNWDPDDMEVQGLRPLFLWFNHLRYLALGEAVVAHRLLLLVLFAAYLALLVSPLRRLGVTVPEAVVAGVLCLASRLSVYHYTFLTDGAHLLQGIAFALALRAMLLYVDGRGRLYLALALVWLAAGLLVREDTLAVAPVLALLALAAGRGQGRAGLRAALIAGAAMALLCVGLMAYRALVVPRPPAYRVDMEGLWRATQTALSLSGRDSFDGLSRAFVRSMRFWPFVVLAGILASPPGRRARALLWLTAAILACSPALMLGRENLLLFPVTFMAVAMATSLGSLASRGWPGRAAAAAALVWLLVGEFRLSREFQLVFHPYSATSLRWSGEFVYGPYWQATVPEVRRQAVIARLASLGIRDEGQFLEKLPRKTYTATVEGPWRPTGEPRLFAPRLAFRAFRP